MNRQDRSDVIIVGGGIVGCATAYYLALRGLSVQIVERGAVAGEQSSRAWGFLRQQGRNAAETPLAAEASRMWNSISRELDADIEFVRNGILVLAETDADEQRMVEGERIARENGVGSRLLSPLEIRKRMPELGRSWRAGLFTKDDGHAEPDKATRAFAVAAKRLGVKIREQTPVVGFEIESNKAVGVMIAEGRLRADTAIVCAAGIGTPDLIRTIGYSLPIQPVRASVAQTNRTSFSNRIAVWSPHVAFRPKVDGSFYIGNGYRGIDAEYDFTPDSLRHLGFFLPTYIANRHTLKLHFGKPFLEGVRRKLAGRGVFAPWSEPAPNKSLVAYNEMQFYQLLPKLNNLGLARSWAGRIDATPDMIPIIGKIDPLEQFHVAAGFNGHGFALAPIIGKLMAETIVDGKPTIDLHSFRPGRFASGDVQRGQGAL